MDSYLSKNIKTLVCDTFNIEILETNNYITEKLTLHWNNISTLLINNQDYFSIHEQSSEWFYEIIKKCTNIWRQSHFSIQNITALQKQTLLENCAWTNRQSDINIYLEKYLNNSSDDVTNIEVVLFLTSVLERSLGNVYLLKGTNVPFLLRELLGTTELLSIFGITPIVLMQILLGTPRTINLRNLVWHGFPKPTEIHISFGAILFLLISSLADILQKENISLKNVHRKQFIVKEYFNEIEKQLEISGLAHIENALKISKHVTVNFLTYWTVILDYYRDEKYGQCLILLLPQVEQLLRNIFCDINDQPKRLLTAEADTLYTTLDDVLNEYIETNINEKKINKIYDILGTGLIQLINDVFSHLAGPRIRDKMSHGEINLEEITKPCLDVMFTIVVAIISKVESLFTNDCEANYNSYESIFHPTAILKRRIIKTIQQIELLKSIEAPTGVIILWDLETNEIYHLCCTINKTFKRNDVKEFDISNISTSLMCAIRNATLKTTYRPKYESEVVSILKRITDNIMLVIDNIITSLNEKLIMYNMRKLRSKRRETYLKLIESVPLFFMSLNAVVFIIIQSYILLQDEMQDFFDKFFIRYLKFTLQYIENMATNFEPNRNRWEESIILTNKFVQQTKEVLNRISFN